MQSNSPMKSGIKQKQLLWVRILQYVVCILLTVESWLLLSYNSGSTETTLLETLPLIILPSCLILSLFTKGRLKWMWASLVVLAVIAAIIYLYLLSTLEIQF